MRLAAAVLVAGLAAGLCGGCDRSTGTVAATSAIVTTYNKVEGYTTIGTSPVPVHTAPDVSVSAWFTVAGDRTQGETSIVYVGFTSRASIRATTLELTVDGQRRAATTLIATSEQAIAQFDPDEFRAIAGAGKVECRLGDRLNLTLPPAALAAFRELGALAHTKGK
jgi:hypothetical protein